MKRPRSKEISVERVVKTSFLVSVLDIAINTFVAIISGSVVMLSQALQGLADLISAGFLMVGVKNSKRKPDQNNPFGYGREIYFWTFLSALVTFTLTAGASFYFGFKRFINPEALDNINVAFITLCIALITNGYSMSLSLKRLLGKARLSKFKSIFLESSLLATKKAFVLDAMGTSAPTLGIFALVLYKITGDLRYDGVGAMLVGITMGILSLFILKSAKDLLVGQSASSEIEAKIINAAESFHSVIEVLELKTLLIGPKKILVNMEVHLADKLTTDEIEKLIDMIEKEIRGSVPEAVSIHIELETPNVK
jgi:cation diffusion facilitator family transporter